MTYSPPLPTLNFHIWLFTMKLQGTFGNRGESIKLLPPRTARYTVGVSHPWLLSDFLQSTFYVSNFSVVHGETSAQMRGELGPVRFKKTHLACYFTAPCANGNTAPPGNGAIGARQLNTHHRSFTAKRGEAYVQPGHFALLQPSFPALSQQKQINRDERSGEHQRDDGRPCGQRQLNRAPNAMLRCRWVCSQTRTRAPTACSHSGFHITIQKPCIKQLVTTENLSFHYYCFNYFSGRFLPWSTNTSGGAQELNQEGWGGQDLPFFAARRIPTAVHCGTMA